MTRGVPIGVRLTLWYGAILAASLAVAGAGAWVSMRASLYSAIDTDLRARAAAAAADLASEVRERPGDGQIPAMLRERRGSDAWQIRGPDGRWIYRTALAEAANSPLPIGSRSGVVVSTIGVNGTRFRSATATASDDRGGTYVIQLVEPLNPEELALGNFARVVALGSPVVLLLACAGGYWISRRALQPVDRITSTARAITARNLSERIPVTRSGDELQRLAETINATFDRLEQAFAQMTQFTADASHELRTPVAFIRTTAEVLLRRGRTEGEWQQGVADIQRETVRMTRLLDDMMTLARAEAGVDLCERSAVDLTAAVAAACRTGAALAASKGVALIAPTEAGAIAVSGDTLLLERLFLILIDNAVKYTPAGGTVSLTTACSRQQVEVSVCDTGIGIAPGDLARVFDRFYRADKARSRESGGAGLGLAIARWIAEIHEGTITAASTVGSGSSFTVTLPLATRS